MNVRSKSLHRSNNCKLANKRKNQRAAKERKRLERANAPIDVDALMDQAAKCYTHKPARSGFKINIECLDDYERASFITARGPHGLTISATACARRIAYVVSNYFPAKTHVTKRTLQHHNRRGLAAVSPRCSASAQP